MQELIAKIEQWAHERNIINGSKPIDQAMKLFSEFGELADNVGKGRDCRDDIGDVFVVLTIMAKQNQINIIDAVSCSSSSPNESTKHAVICIAGCLEYFVNDCGINSLCECIEALDSLCDNLKINLQECVQIAYDDIKDRKSVMSNGVFIKESDPAYASVIASLESNFNV